MTIPAGRDWRAVLLALVSGGGAVVAFSMVPPKILLPFLGPRLAGAGGTAPDLLERLLGSLAVLFMGTLLGLTCVTAVRVLRGRPSRTLMYLPIRRTTAAIGLLIWLAASLTAQLASSSSTWRWLVPALHVLAISTPLFLALRFIAGALGGGAGLRLWGSLAMGMVGAPALAAVVEVMLLGLVLVAGALFLALRPDLLLQAQRLLLGLRGARTEEAIFQSLGGLLTNPTLIVALLIGIAGIVPVVEELAKSTVAWAVIDRVPSPAQGFLTGAVAGAGFALFEGLLVPGGTGGGLGAVLLLRGGSSMMHVLSAAITGWGITRFHQDSDPVGMLFSYLSAICLHAVWNGSIVLIGLGAARASILGPASDLLGASLVAVGGLALAGMLVFEPAAVFVFSRMLGRSENAATAHLVESRVPQGG